MVRASRRTSTYQTEMAWRQDDARRAALARIRTEADLLRLQGELRTKLLRMLGGLPSTRTPLNAQVTGQIPMTGFHIEKVVFESLPGIFVTALVYIPDGGRKHHPAVLVASGHSANGKAYYQALCQRLAARGYVVISWDPVGQGERSQFWDAAARKSRYNLICGEHAVLGNLAYLAGANIARWEVWDGMRALDYLLTRPEVDPARISITGTSGGGFQAAIDRRARFADPRRGAVLFHHRAPDARVQSHLRGSRQRPRAGCLPHDRRRRRSRGPAAADVSPARLRGGCGARLLPDRGHAPDIPEVAAIYRRFGHSDRIAMHEGYHKHEFSVENQAAAFTFLDRFNGMPAQPGLATTTALDDRGAALHAHGPGAARSRGRQEIDGRDPRLLPRQRQHTGDTPSSGVFWTRLPGHRALASRAIRRVGLRKAADPVGGGRQVYLRRRLNRQVRAASQRRSLDAAAPPAPGGRQSSEGVAVGQRSWKGATRTTGVPCSSTSRTATSGLVRWPGLGETRMRYTALSIDDPSLAQQEFDRAYTSPLSGVLANYVYNSLLTGRPYLLQMIEDVEIAARFARIRLDATDISITATGDAYTLAHDAAGVLPGLRLLPDDNGRVLSWAQLVKDKQEVWPVQYILPGGAYLR